MEVTLKSMVSRLMCYNGRSKRTKHDMNHSPIASCCVLSTNASIHPDHSSHNEHLSMMHSLLITIEYMVDYYLLHIFGLVFIIYNNARKIYFIFRQSSSLFEWVNKQPGWIMLRPIAMWINSWGTYFRLVFTFN